MPTDEDVAALKANWIADDCWDIENTEGFEAYHDELLDFRRKIEKVWKDAREAAIVRKAFELGVPDSLKLAEHIMFLEVQIVKLKDTIRTHGHNQ